MPQTPILVVCLTNHALDSFLADLRNAGIVNFARIGSGSKESWTREFELRKLTHRLKKTTFEKTSSQSVYHQVEGKYLVSYPSSLSRYYLKRLTRPRSLDRRYELVRIS